jgi:septum formation protein
VLRDPVKAPRLVLASGSPRRAELLGRLGLSFDVRPARVDESQQPGEPPGEMARRLAREKAATVAGELGAGLVLAADTLVVVDGLVLGKPEDDREARRMLEQLSGREHRVLTGVAVRDASSGRTAEGVESTAVRFDELSSTLLDWYLRGGEGRDKAGSYGLQGAGAWLVDHVAGCPSNVVGLPPSLVKRLLEQVGWPLERLIG